MSDNELDAELLALAGEESSDLDEEGEEDQENDVPSRKASTSTSPPSLSIHSSSPHSPTPNKIPPSPSPHSSPQKKILFKQKSAVRKRKKEESEEEGEASSGTSTPNSLGSGAMSESDSDAMPGEIADPKIPYPLEGKFKDEIDKTEILAMTEIRREEVLAERAVEIDTINQNQQLRRLIQDRERQEAKLAERKRKASSDDFEDSQHSKSCRKTKTSMAIEEYRNQRKQREQQRNQSDHKTKEHRSLPVEKARSDIDAGVESETDLDKVKKSGIPVCEEPLADLKDFERCRVGRSNFAKVCFYPGFDAAIAGCYCRVNVGIDQSTRQNVYRLALIKRFTEGKPYVMEGVNGKPFMTDQYAYVAHGKAEKEWPFVTCSDSPFTENELERYKKQLVFDGLKYPLKKELVTKLDDIHGLLNRPWTSEDIDAKLTRQKKYAIAHNPTSTSTMTGNKGMDQQERLAALNKANRKANTEEVRRALIKEKRQEKAARAAAAARKAMLLTDGISTDKAKSLTVPGDDLFGDGVSDQSRAATPAARTPNREHTPQSTVPLATSRPEIMSGIPTFRRRNMDDDLIAAMDLGIEIDI